MIIDTSALLAILRDEPEAAAYADAIQAASRGLDDLLQEAQISIEPVTETQARIAREAYRDFGRGSGHPARLSASATASPTPSRRQ
jgi:ribonuclease VapC